MPAQRPGPGGRHCQKTSVEHKACELPPCPKGTPSFRDLQCLSYHRHANKKKGNMLTSIINDGETLSLVVEARHLIFEIEIITLPQKSANQD